MKSIWFLLVGLFLFQITMYTENYLISSISMGIGAFLIIYSYTLLDKDKKE